MTTASHRMRVLRPATIAEALELAAETGARIISGGTALQLDWAKGVVQPRMLVALDRIAGLGDVSMAAGKVRIGALATLGALERDATIASALPLLCTAIRCTAGPSVRNLATIGGNIAGRAGCLLPALLALDAEVIVSDCYGEVTLPLTDWLPRQAHEPQIVTAIVVPLPVGASLWTHRKIGLRAAFTPGVISVAARLSCADGRITSARLAVGSGVVEPARLRGVETRLTGSELACADWSELREMIMQEIVAPDDAFRSARYRRRVAANALIHGLGGALPHSGRTRSAAVATQPEPLAGEIRLARESAGAHWHIRPDGPPKIAGRLEYLTDRREPGMLVARILRAGVPHARILSIDTSRAEALPGVAAVVTHSDVAGSNAFGIVVQDQPALCFDKVRYAGDAVAAVAADDAETAARALDLIDVRYELLPTVCDPQAALLASAEPVHAAGNLQRQLELRRGDIAEAFRRAAHIVEATYVTPRQMHGFMETEGGFAKVEEDGTLTVCAGGQHGSRDRMQLSRILGIPEERIRVVTSPTGGAFGGKDELTVQPALALLALKTGRTVRIQLDRAESILAGTKRNPMRIRMRTACDADGLLIAQEVDLLADAGAYASLGPGVMETALEHACGPYLVPNVHTEGRLAYTNNGVCGAFRGFGANQMSYAIECQMDRLAAMSGLDRFEIRRRNMRRPGSRGYLGQKVAPSERLLEMLQAAEADPIWRQSRGLSDDGAELIGIGMAMNYQGNGLGTLPPDPGGGALRLAPDGAVEALYGLDEMGQGLLTSVKGAVAAALGCGREDVRPITGDTGRAPESGSTTASRGTYVVWRVAESTAPAFGTAIRAAAGRLLGRDAEALAIVPGGVAERGSNSGEILLTFAEIARSMPEGALPFVETSFEFPKSDYIDGNARLIFAFGATLARVAVSRITGQVRVLDLHQHTAAGPMLDVAAYLGQIEGGGVQGLGFTLSEDALMQDGRFVTANLDTYMLPGIADVPRTLASFALEELDAGDPFGPRGAGELGIGAVTPAIANAVADATGFWPETTPFNPERLLDVVGAAA